ncbi:hypothetical protein AcW1_010169 [Taiwanofungus camphoratus]|nr:hypothetical protein AcW1_010169 [Antrodia cinnamomea]
MSTTSSVQNSLYLMANWVHLALSHLPGPNHLHHIWFEERLEQELHPFHNLLMMASTAGEWPYVPAIILSSAGEFVHAAQHGVPVHLEVIVVDDLDVKANPWYSEPPEGAMAEMGEDSMEDTLWQAEAVSGAKRTQEKVVEDEVEKGQRRKKVRMGPDVTVVHNTSTPAVVLVGMDSSAMQALGRVEEDVEMEDMSPDERAQHCKEK